MNLYGHEMSIEEPALGSLVTEVLVIARQVEYDERGRAMDGLLISSSNSTTHMIQRVMTETALDMLMDEDDE